MPIKETMKAAPSAELSSSFRSRILSCRGKGLGYIAFAKPHLNAGAKLLYTRQLQASSAGGHNAR
jgi:hypothetical protein